MATLREIRRKLHSIENIEKITQAMEMVAASRLRRAQAKADISRLYSLKLKGILDQLIATSDDFMHPLIKERKVKKTGFIVIAADRGLCGAYNYNVFSTTEKLLKNYSLTQVELILVGRKTVDYFSNKQWKIGTKISEWGGKIKYSQINDLTQKLINQYLSHELDEIWLIYTHYINISSRKVTIEKLLNIDQSNFTKEVILSNYIVEPTIPEILAEILPRYCATKVQSALNDSYASELAARIFSMRSATKNAEEMIEHLTLTRNKIRQTNITKELIEIASCVEILK